MELKIFGGNSGWSAHGEYEPIVDEPLKPCPFCGGRIIDVSNTHTLLQRRMQDLSGISARQF